jgi:hypothetical protein
MGEALSGRHRGPDELTQIANRLAAEECRTIFGGGVREPPSPFQSSYRPLVPHRADFGIAKFAIGSPQHASAPLVRDAGTFEAAGDEVAEM